MNNITTSDYSCESESGWTTYWAQLSNSIDSNYNEKISTHNIVNEYIDVDDDNLSMVSDASSGPRPNINEDHCSSFSGSKKSSNRKNKTTEDEKHSQFCLDDTATSHFLHFYQDNVGPNQNHYSSVEHFEREPSPKKHLGYAKSPTKGKSGGVRGRKRQ